MDNTAVNDVVKTPAIQDRLARYGSRPLADSTPAGTKRFVPAEIAKWRTACDLTGLEPQCAVIAAKPS